MKIAVVTDEISSDLETALELATSWTIDGVELRGIGTERFPRVSRYWQRRVPSLIAESGLPVAAISAGLFKIPYPTTPHHQTRNLRWEDAAVTDSYQAALDRVHDHVDVLLPEVITAAHQLGAETIICFSFDRGPGVPAGQAPDEVVQVLRTAAERVSAAGLRLVMEVEHICWADTGAAAATLLERVGHPGLGINWDPANTVLAGDDSPFPDGFNAVRSRVQHVHFKDARVDPAGVREFHPDGIVDWAGQVGALRSVGYDGWITVETHARPKIARTYEAIERLRELLGAVS